jgi:hypothetical protein
MVAFEPSNKELIAYKPEIDVVDSRLATVIVDTIGLYGFTA